MPALNKRLDAWRAKQTKSVAKKPEMKIERLEQTRATGRHHRHYRRRPAGPHAGAGGGAAGAEDRIYNDEPDAPAFQVTPLQVAAPYDDRMRCARFADVCDVITFEFENLPAHAIAYLAEHVPVRPGAACAGDDPGPAHRKKPLSKSWA